MRTNSAKSEKEREKERKKQQQAFEAQIFIAIEKTLDSVVEKALNEIFKDFNKKK